MKLVPTKLHEANKLVVTSEALFKFCYTEHMTFQNNSIFWVEVQRIVPNPYQPRRHFDEERLKDLANSIRQYGVLQPLVVTQREVSRENGGMGMEYELIAGERRLRASKMAGLSQVPVIIRDDHENEQVKLELAIIENLQREDINAVERARAFKQLAETFGLSHTDIAKKIGRSREYVSNTLRILQLPEAMQQALAENQITEGHTRPLLMLADRPEEQMTLFKEIIAKKINVRDAEQISRRIAYDKVRKRERMYDPDIVELEERASESLGTRVRVEPGAVGGRILIDVMSEDDVRKVLHILNGDQTLQTEQTYQTEQTPEASEAQRSSTKLDETSSSDEDLYSINNFSV